jgi:SP family facilitated glucose transporter-like MFS transporter 1
MNVIIQKYQVIKQFKYYSGWNLGLFNTPENVIKDFYRNVYLERHNSTMTNETMTALWSITNGLMPFGGIFGGLSSGFMADYFGRLALNLLMLHFVIH